MADLTRARAPGSLQKLLKIAREDATALRVDLADIRRARLSVESSIAGLDEKTQCEEQTAPRAPASGAAARREEARARRTSLQACLLTFAKAEDAIRDKLEGAMAEIKKLENLVLPARRAVHRAESSRANKLAAAGKAS